MINQRDKDKLITAALDLCGRQGFHATTVAQIAAAAAIPPEQFTYHFPTTDAVILSLVADLMHGIVAALAHEKIDDDPTEALLNANTHTLTAILEGRGVITRDQLLAMSQIMAATPTLQQQASTIRKHILSHGLADLMQLDPQDRRIRRAVTMWSAIAVGLYTGCRLLPPNYDPHHDGSLSERMIDRLSQTFDEVMGRAPRENTD